MSQVAVESPPSPLTPLARLDSILDLYEDGGWDTAVNGFKGAFVRATTATPGIKDPTLAALVGSLLYGKEKQQILLLHCLLHNEPDALMLHNLLVAREIEQRENAGSFVNDHMSSIANLKGPLWPSEEAFDSLNDKLLERTTTTPSAVNDNRNGTCNEAADGVDGAPEQEHIESADSLPMPALALSRALHFADPTFACLSGLEHASQGWRDALVLTTDFWLPDYSIGELHKLVNLAEGISSLTAASIRFDPDRELSIAHGSATGTTKDLRTQAALATARRIRVLSSFPVASLPALFKMMPSLTAVRFVDTEQLTASLAALASLEQLQELTVTNCSGLTDLSVLVALPAVRMLNLRGCDSLVSVSALTSMRSLRELRLGGCSRETLSGVDALRSIRVRVLFGDPWEFDDKTSPSDVPVDLLDTFVEFLRSDDPKENLQGTLMIRKMLCVFEENAPCTEVIEQGCVPLFASQLLRDKSPRLQFESVWALGNIIGDCDHVSVVDCPGAVPNIVRLLDSPDEYCRQQASWTIGNLAGADAPSRDVCLDNGALQPLVAILNAPGQMEATRRDAAWALSNLCRGKPRPEHDKIAPLLPVLVDMLNHEDDEVVVYGAWGLEYLSNGPRVRIQHVLDTGCLPRMVELLDASKSAVITPAIRAVGNFASGDDHQTQAVIDAGALKAFHSLLNNPKSAIRKEACWALSNITAGSQGQIQAVIDEHLIPAIINATEATELEVKKEAAWAITNAAADGSRAQVEYLVQASVLPCLCQLLTDSRFCPGTVTRVLEGIESTLNAGWQVCEESNPYADEVVNCGGKDRIEELADHHNTDIRDHAQSVLQALVRRSAVVSNSTEAA